MPRAFISYSWDSEEHRNWVRDFAGRLRSDGIETVLDQWHVVPGDQLPEFMERSVRESDHVLIVCTRNYKTKSDGRKGGVGYEGDIMTAVVLQSRPNRKFIPILREQPKEDSIPDWLGGKYFVDLSGTPYADDQYHDVVATMLGTRASAPPVGATQAQASEVSPELAEDDLGIAHFGFRPIKITGIIVDNVGVPSMDGTRGSALYTVPFQLSGQPQTEWAEYFVQAWNSPERFTTMHRPGIASVDASMVILTGTTLEEVERYHRDTLVYAAERANTQYIELLANRHAAAEQERIRWRDHDEEVRKISKRIKFD